MALTTTHYKTIIAILIVIAGISLTYNFLNCFSKNTENVVTYESIENAGNQKNSLKIDFPSTWTLQSGRTNVVISAPDQKAQFFLPMTPADLEGLSPLSDEMIQIGDKSYRQKTYGAGSLKAVFLEDFSYGTTTGIGYKYEDEQHKSKLQEMLFSQKIL